MGQGVVSLSQVLINKGLENLCQRWRHLVNYRDTGHNVRADNALQDI